MKTIQFLSLPLLVSCAAVKNELYWKQGLDLFGLSTADLNAKAPVSVEKLEPIIQKDAIRERIIWGPFKLEPAKAQHAEGGAVLRVDPNSNVISTRVAGLCKDCMVLNAKADISNEQGDKLDAGSGVSSHQITMTDIGHPMVLPPAFAQCANGGSGESQFEAQVKVALKEFGEFNESHGVQRNEAPPPETPPASTSATKPAPTKASTAASTTASTLTPVTAPVITPTVAPAPPVNPFAALGLPSSFIDKIPKEPTAVLGGAAGAVIGAALMAALGALLGAGLGSIAATPGGVSSLANLLPKMPQISIFIDQGDAGSDFTPRNRIVKSGFWIDAKDEINLMSELINHNNETRNIYVQMEYEYLPMPSRPAEYLDVGHGTISVSPCASGKMMPPKDSAIRYSSPPWNVIQDGYLMDIKPHLQDGGLNMTFFVNGQMECSSQAIYGGMNEELPINGEKWETITAHSGCPNAIAIKTGDIITMEAYYDLTQHKIRQQSENSGSEAEGIASANFVYARPYSGI